MAIIDPMLISTIRKSMPDQIAKSILSVQPMTGLWATGTGGKSIFTSRYGIRYAAVSNDYYQHFVRINNRRKTQSLKEFRQAQYPESPVSDIKADIKDFEQWAAWMNCNIGKYRYFLIGWNCFFVDSSDKMLYDLTWSKTD